MCIFVKREQNVLLLCVHIGIINRSKENSKILEECYSMAAKSANLYARIEPDVKEQAEPNLHSKIRSTVPVLTGSQEKLYI